MNKYHEYISLWEEGRTRFSKLLTDLREEDLTKKLFPAPNSAGFLIRHIGDVELLFAKNVFNYEGVKVHAKTVIAQRDTGEWTKLSDLLAYDQLAFESLRSSLLAHDEQAWEESVITKEFGTKTKAESLGRIITHTAYHAGQLAMILKYGV